MQPSSLFPDALQPIRYGSDFFRNSRVPNPIQLIRAPTLDQARDTETICRIFNDTVCYPTFNPNNSYSQDEKTYAGYGQVNFDFGRVDIPVDGNVGVRWAKTDLGTVGVVTSPTGAVSPINQSASYENWLPGANVRWKITPELFLRLTRETVNLPQHPNNTGADITWPQNGSNGTIKGAEIGVQTFFDFLPAPLDGFGVQANYTYVKSKAPGPIVGTSVALQGLSKNSYNLVGFYEKGGFRARIAYNWRDDLVETTSGPGSGALPIYDKPLGVLDASIGYNFNERFDISITASNLTNAQSQSYFGDGNRPRFDSIFDRRIGAVLRVTL